MGLSEEEQFEELIQALIALEKQLLESCETMRVCVEVCASEMEEDDLSSNFREQVASCEKDIRNKEHDIAVFRKELGSKLEQLEELKKKSQGV